MEIEVVMKTYILEVNDKWYHLDCSFKVGNWIDQQDRLQWEPEGPRSQCRYWVHKELMVLLLLRWPNEVLEQK